MKPIRCQAHGNHHHDKCRECLGKSSCNGCGNWTTDPCKKPCEFAAPPSPEEKAAAAKKQAVAELALKVANITDRDYLRKLCAATVDGHLQKLGGVLRIAAALEGIEDQLAEMNRRRTP